MCTDAKKSPRAHQCGALVAVGEGPAAPDRVELVVLPISLPAQTLTECERGATEVCQGQASVFSAC